MSVSWDPCAGLRSPATRHPSEAAIGNALSKLSTWRTAGDASGGACGARRALSEPCGEPVCSESDGLLGSDAVFRRRTSASKGDAKEPPTAACAVACGACPDPGDGDRSRPAPRLSPGLPEPAAVLETARVDDPEDRVCPGLVSAPPPTWIGGWSALATVAHKIGHAEKDVYICGAHEREN